jgi:hypothetical protein
VGYRVEPSEVHTLSAAVAAAGVNGSTSHQFYAMVSVLFEQLGLTRACICRFLWGWGSVSRRFWLVGCVWQLYAWDLQLMVHYQPLMYELGWHCWCMPNRNVTTSTSRRHDKVQAPVAAVLGGM